MFRQVVEEPVTVTPSGRRLLQCRSRGDRRYSPFFCTLSAFGESAPIEHHYQSSKVFAGGREPPIAEREQNAERASPGEEVSLHTRVKA